MNESTNTKKLLIMPPDRLHHLIQNLNKVPLLRGFPVSLSVAAVLVTGMANIALQVSSPQDPIWVEHLTLEGALCAAVVVLWRALVKKDEQLVQSTKIVTEALAASASSNTELRRTIEVLRAQLGNEGHVHVVR